MPKPTQAISKNIFTILNWEQIVQNMKFISVLWRNINFTMYSGNWVVYLILLAAISLLIWGVRMSQPLLIHSKLSAAQLHKGRSTWWCVNSTLCFSLAKVMTGAWCAQTHQIFWIKSWFSDCHSDICSVGLNDISLSYLYLDMNIQDINIEKETI